MAQKRMFDKTITNSDDFLELPDSSQVLYFHLNMNADDDGFVNNWKSILKMTGTKEDDLKILIAKSFVIPFDSGVIVIKHWRINNYLRNDRYKMTNYKDELSMLNVDENGEYLLSNNDIGIPLVYPVKNSIEKNSIDKNNNITDAKQVLSTNIFDYYQERIGILSPNQYEKMNEYITKYSEDKIKEAIDTSCDNGVKTFNYFSSVLTNGVFKKGTIIAYKKQNNTPEWMNKEQQSEEMSEDELKELEKEMSIFD